MEHLDDELLGRIFLFVPREDQLKIFRVSRKWSRVMDENVGIDTRVGRGLHSQLEGITFDSMQILSKVGVRSCLFDSFVNDSPNPTKLKRPNLLKYLTIKGFMSSATFESITNGVTNLHTFQINHAALNQLEFLDISFNLPCQSLEVVGCDEFQWNPVSGLASATKINAIYLFRNVFPGLKRVWINLNCIDQIQDLLANALLTLIMTHSTSLTYVYIEFICTERLDPYHIRNFYRTVSSVTASDTQVSVPQLTSMEIDKKEYPNLRELHLLMPEFDAGRIEAWTSWLKQLRHLEFCEITRSFPQSAFNSLATQCQATLKTMEINWNLDQRHSDIRTPSGVNCSIFQNCSNLTKLKMNGKKDTILQKVPSGLLDIESLPKFLITIEITDINIPSSSCEYLCLNFPALERLTLTDICEPGSVGYGVMLPVIREIIRRKQLKHFKLEIGHGNEEDAQEEVIRDAFRRLSGISSRILCTTEGFLNTDGKYTVAKMD